MQEILNTFQSVGYSVFKKTDPTFIPSLIDQLGEVFREDDIVVNYNKKRLLYSDNAMPMHHDHPAAKYIIWKCIRQSSEGGFSILLDFEKIYQQLSIDDQLNLENVYCKIPTMKKVRPTLKPIVSYDQNGKPIYYFAPWLLNIPKDEKLQKAVSNTKLLIQNSTPTKIRLLPDDVLLVDNTRMLHSRGPILGDKDRLLKRYWVHSSF